MTTPSSSGVSSGADAQAQRRAVVVAGYVGDTQVVRQAMGHDDPRVRASALAALHRIGSLSDDTLRSTFSDPSAIVRRRAASLSINYPQVSPRALLVDEDDTVVEVAVWAYGERVEADHAVVAKLCEMGKGHANPLVREAAVAALGAIGHPDGLGTILAATNDRIAVRRRAVLALAPFEGPEVTVALQRALTDKDWQTREAAELLTQS
ncbi:MAG: hypothetical protein F4X48_00705 [Acidimicrobiia bacterium]|nr:hypothetical protein [Acidimicrobiia bacterium]MYC57098.1 hypothetical protein [Acidimicrobiia bacterium]MYI30175.1 hypothetical protein [Acidimicrobiia bacterium]